MLILITQEAKPGFVLYHVNFSAISHHLRPIPLISMSWGFPVTFCCYHAVRNHHSAARAMRKSRWVLLTVMMYHSCMYSTVYTYSDSVGNDLLVLNSITWWIIFTICIGESRWRLTLMNSQRTLPAKMTDSVCSILQMDAETAGRNWMVFHLKCCKLVILNDQEMAIRESQRLCPHNRNYYSIVIIHKLIMDTMYMKK